MATHDIPELDTQGLRRFGLTTGGIVAVLFGVAIPWVFGLSFPLWPWIVGGILGVWGLLAPNSLRPVYIGWMKFGLLLSRITTPLILGIVFFLVITPVAVFMKLTKRDALRRELDPDAGSYRVESHSTPPEQLEKPF